MKKRQRILPCGRVVYFEETYPQDIANSKSISRALLASRKKLDALVSFKSAGKRNKQWVPRVYNKFTTFLVEHLLERLLEGDRIFTYKGNVWMISGRGDGGKYVNWHSDGKSYGIVIKGINSKFGIRMSRAKRKELKERILNGQNYHA